MVREVIHQIIDTTTDEIIELSVVEGYELPSSNSIIVNESATGNSAVTYNNGRVQETIPVNGTILALDSDDLSNKLTKLQTLKDNGVIVEYIKPIKNNNRSNKYFIQDMTPTISGHDDSATFTMTLTEYRQANVRQIAVNLVGFESADRMRQLYNERIGNV